MRRRYFFIPLIVIIIITGVLVWSCKHPLVTGIPGIANEGTSGNGGGEEEVKAYLSQEEQNQSYEYEDILFTGTGSQIPALTVTAKEVIIAASGTSAGSVSIKRSSDMGMTWVDSDFISDSGYSYPFFINCHNGDILLGVTTAASSKDSQTIFYRSNNDGETWSKEGNSIGLKTVTNDATDSSVNYGQGIALRHGGNIGSQKLMFPYFYNAPDGTKPGCYVAIMSSEDDGRSFTTVCQGFTNGGNFNNRNIGSFGSYISKIIELANGDILLNMRTKPGFGSGFTFWMLSANCGESWNITVNNSSEENKVNNGGKEGVWAKHADFIRYEFNGKDIKLGGSQWALMVTSYESKSGYSVMMTKNDFNNGKAEGGTNAKYAYTKELTAGQMGGYPAITVLPDGTIATLTEDNGDLYFKRFNLYWLTDGAESINYNTDTSVKF